jgi:hypothetical protein
VEHQTPLVGLSDSITVEEVRRRLSKLERRKATGPDRIAAAELREVVDELAPGLTSLLNDVLRTGCYPQGWQHGVVVPIYKGKGARSKPGNYRPIRLLSNAGKLLEGILAGRLRDALVAAGRFPAEQGGFRKGVGTEETLLMVTEELFARTRRPGTDYAAGNAVFLDPSKAFDRVDRRVLRERLETVRVTGPMLETLDSFLTATTQQTRVDQQQLSDSLENDHGTPRGSALSPILFAIFMAGLAERLESRLILFADDLTLVNTSPTRQQQVDELRADLRELQRWADETGMLFNGGKSTHVEFRAPGQGRRNTSRAWRSEERPSRTRARRRFSVSCYPKTLDLNRHADEVTLPRLRLQLHYNKHLLPRSGSTG